MVVQLPPSLVSSFNSLLIGQPASWWCLQHTQLRPACRPLDPLFPLPGRPFSQVPLPPLHVAPLATSNLAQVSLIKPIVPDHLPPYPDGLLLPDTYHHISVYLWIHISSLNISLMGAGKSSVLFIAASPTLRTGPLTLWDPGK